MVSKKLSFENIICKIRFKPLIYEYRVYAENARQHSQLPAYIFDVETIFFYSVQGRKELKVNGTI